jgi:hypothetical protein
MATIAAIIKGGPTSYCFYSVFTPYSDNHQNANFAIGVKLLSSNHVESRCHGRRCIRLGANKNAAPVACSLRYPELRDAGSAEGPSNMRTRLEESAA